MEEVFENNQLNDETEKTIQQVSAKPVFVAELTRWDNRVEKQVIEKDWIDDMVFAVRSQMWVQNRKTGLEIYGAKYRHIEVYEIV